jgi:AraC-like DNA-binding protein
MYALRPPAPPLRPYIEHYWAVTPAPGESLDLRVDVFVDGRADLIFNFGAPYTREVIGGAAVSVATSNLDAQRAYPIRITQRGAMATCGVRFQLGGLAPFTDVSLRDFTGQTPPPVAVFGDAVLRLEDSLRADPDLDARAGHLDAFFLGMLLGSPSRTRVARALEHLRGGGGSVAEASAAAKVSARQLDRLFAQHVGLSPKTVARVLRFQTALRGLMRDPNCALARLAAACGYFDQSHFIKDFRKFTGGVPRGYLGYFPEAGPSDFAPNVVAFLQDRGG